MPTDAVSVIIYSVYLALAAFWYLSGSAYFLIGSDHVKKWEMNEVLLLVQEHLDAVLRMASDQLCNTCYEMNVDPFILDYWQPGVDYIVTPFEPEVLE